MGLLYRSIVALHPPAFRQQFGAEMELIFDESGRQPRLLWDVLFSLIRQWFLRRRIWIFGLAGVGGAIPFALAFGFLNAAMNWYRVPPHVRSHVHRAAVRTVEPVDGQFLILATMIAVMFISGTMSFAIAWFRYSQRRRRV